MKQDGMGVHQWQTDENESGKSMFMDGGGVVHCCDGVECSQPRDSGKWRITSQGPLPPVAFPWLCSHEPLLGRFSCEPSNANDHAPSFYSIILFWLSVRS